MTPLPFGGANRRHFRMGEACRRPAAYRLAAHEHEQVSRQAMAHDEFRIGLEGPFNGVANGRAVGQVVGHCLVEGIGGRRLRRRQGQATLVRRHGSRLFWLNSGATKVDQAMARVHAPQGALATAKPLR